MQLLFPLFCCISEILLLLTIQQNSGFSRFFTKSCAHFSSLFRNSSFFHEILRHLFVIIPKFLSFSRNYTLLLRYNSWVFSVFHEILRSFYVIFLEFFIFSRNLALPFRYNSEIPQFFTKSCATFYVIIPGFSRFFTKSCALFSSLFRNSSSFHEIFRSLFVIIPEFFIFSRNLILTLCIPKKFFTK